MKPADNSLAKDTQDYQLKATELDVATNSRPQSLTTLATATNVISRSDSSPADEDAEADALVIVVVQVPKRGSARLAAGITAKLKAEESALEQESREEAKQAQACAGVLDGKGASAFNAETLSLGHRHPQRHVGSAIHKVVISSEMDSDGARPTLLSFMSSGHSQEYAYKAKRPFAF